MAEGTDTGLPVNRVEALTDGVFAIAMTILVLGVQLPHTTDGLGARLLALWPKLASYVLSFVMLGVLWIGHHYQLNHLRRMNRVLIWLNLWFLLAITFLPFGADVLGAEYHDPAAVALYAGTILLAGTSLLAHWVYATSRKELVVDGLDPELVRGLRLRILFGMGVTAASIAVAFADTRASLAVLLVLPIGYFARSRIDARIAPRR
jgi:TMEM175 potassium channel family protein